MQCFTIVGLIKTSQIPPSQSQTMLPWNIKIPLWNTFFHTRWCAYFNDSFSIKLIELVQVVLSVCVCVGVSTCVTVSMCACVAVCACHHVSLSVCVCVPAGMFASVTHSLSVCRCVAVTISSMYVYVCWQYVCVFLPIFVLFQDYDLLFINHTLTWNHCHNTLCYFKPKMSTLKYRTEMYVKKIWPV